MEEVPSLYSSTCGASQTDDNYPFTTEKNRTVFSLREQRNVDCSLRNGIELVKPFGIIVHK